MDTLIQICAVCLTGALAALLLKNNSPVFTLLLLMAVGILVIRSASGFIEDALDFISELVYLSGLNNAIFAPLLKTVGISIITKVSSDLCRDAGAAAAAGLVETSGALCAIITAIPLMRSVLELVMSFI
ncbi:MAG: SpoIIIAC/SpoIIIAD family protein [Oscillospiraceae bacterium]|nr:SpoIIIAC/SpoIIIAD family protein [Oscillospiraceae bacterium]